VAQNLAQGADLHLQVVLFDYDARPCRLEQFAFGYHPLTVLHEHAQHIEGPRAYGHGPASKLQLAPG